LKKKDWWLEQWHDLYYKLTPPSGEKFAMTCKEAVEQINAESKQSWLGWLRLKLHLSLCSACRYYYRASQILGQAFRQMVDKAGFVDVDQINQELLKKHSQKSSK
jgi:hypothetical protein